MQKKERSKEKELQKLSQKQNPYEQVIMRNNEKI